MLKDQYCFPWKNADFPNSTCNFVGFSIMHVIIHLYKYNMILYKRRCNMHAYQNTNFGKHMQLANLKQKTSVNHQSKHPFIQIFKLPTIYYKVCSSLHLCAPQIHPRPWDLWLSSSQWSSAWVKMLSEVPVGNTPTHSSKRILWQMQDYTYLHQQHTQFLPKWPSAQSFLFSFNKKRCGNKNKGTVDTENP